MTAPLTTAGPCLAGEPRCPGEQYCAFRLAGSWAHCRQVLIANDKHPHASPIPEAADSRELAA